MNPVPGNTSQILRTFLVIFGASGDLAERKLIPALFALYRKGRLLANLTILGYSRSNWSHEHYRDLMHAAVEKYGTSPFSKQEWEEFSKRLYYQPGNFSEAEGFERLATSMDALMHGPSNLLFYLATPPRFFAEIVAFLAAKGLLVERDGWRQVYGC
jgi:glucose-6-phosphate 1-dehydrogenase